MGIPRQKPAFPSEAALMTPASRVAPTRSGVRFGGYAVKWNAVRAAGVGDPTATLSGNPFTDRKPVPTTQMRA